jgi:hypothetical protein
MLSSANDVSLESLAVANSDVVENCCFSVACGLHSIWRAPNSHRLLIVFRHTLSTAAIVRLNTVRARFAHVWMWGTCNRSSLRVVLSFIVLFLLSHSQAWFLARPFGSLTWQTDSASLRAGFWAVWRVWLVCCLARLNGCLMLALCVGRVSRVLALLLALDLVDMRRAVALEWWCKFPEWIVVFDTDRTL